MLDKIKQRANEALKETIQIYLGALLLIFVFAIACGVLYTLVFVIIEPCFAFLTSKCNEYVAVGVLLVIGIPLGLFLIEFIGGFDFSAEALMEITEIGDKNEND